jgi:16S rRNA (adenine1518-N6/adenine1519-N6)-dimethyltransferase
VNKNDKYFKKEFGQNFLTDIETAIEFVEHAGIKGEDTVIEIGPGEGVITQFLLQEAKKVICVEIDVRFVNELRHKFKSYIKTGKLEVIHSDVLELSAASLQLPAYKIVGSLPYNISKQIIKKFLEAENPPESMTFIIQKEVAEDYAAKPSKATFLSNYASLFSDVKYLQKVRKEFFKPQPKVEGGIIKFTMTNDQISETEREALVKFLKSAFLNPRKKLLKNLNSIYRIDKENLKSIFQKVGVGENARASELKLDQWKKLHSYIVA